MALIINGNDAVCWGFATNIKTTITRSGRSVTQFSVQYGKEDEEKLYQNCVAWNDLSRCYLNRLDRGDYLIVCGRLERNKYWSEKKGHDEFDIIVEWANVQDKFDGDDVDEEIDLSDL